MVDNQKVLNSKKYDFFIVGAGLAGAVLAERIVSQLDKRVLVIDKRPHIGGNCYDYVDKNRILIQRYGPHVFHTSDEKVFYYLSQFTDWHDYKLRVLSFYKGNYYQMPINLETVNRFYGVKLIGKKELKGFLEKKLTPKRTVNLRETVVSGACEELYEALIKNYTQKQWGMPPEELDKSILQRIPLRYNKESGYFQDKYQGLPKLGYSHMINNMLKSKYITVILNTDFFKMAHKPAYKKLIYTGPIDEFFGYRFGRLQYRGIRFSFKVHALESFQQNSIINFPEPNVPYTRITEFKKFYNNRTPNTVICKEFPVWDEEPAYPVINQKNTMLLKRYLREAKKLKDVIFVGRLAQYRYLDMDDTVKEALKIFEDIF